MLKKTKIVCTVGPSTDSPAVLPQMIAAGMNVARFNFSHGNHEDHGKRIAMVRAAAREAQSQVALMLDTKGPEMRIGKFAAGKVSLVKDNSVVLTAADIVGDENRVSISYKHLPYEINQGAIILLADGLISLRVEQIAQEDIITTVLNSGEISNNKRLAVPGVYIGLPPVSDQDREDILFGVQQGMDYIAASFIQSANDVLAIRRIIEEAGGEMGIIAKIENMFGVENIDEILKVADGIMVARGDLGVEIPAEDVPLVQKMLIDKCNKAGKPVITATQMLESMIVNPRPTRAEASDVANAIMDGSDAIMLSGETASGQYPVEAVDTMAKIAMRTEQALPYSDILRNKGLSVNNTTTDAISHATVQIAHQLEAAAVITSTESGYTSRMVAKYRPQACVIAATPNEKTARAVQLLWGVHPVVVGSFQNSDEMVNNAVLSSLQAGVIKEGDLVVVTAGVPAGASGTTNLIRVHAVGKILLKGVGIGQRVVSGTVCVVKSPKELTTKFQPGDILVVSSIDDETAYLASKALAIVTEEGGLTSHAAVLGVSYDIPVVVSAENALGVLTDGAIVTVDAARGLIYQGEIKAK